MSPARPFEFQGSDRFEIQRRLGAGGMGIVYEALDRESNTRVALKTLRYVDPQGILRLKREFRSLQDLEHPNLVSLGELFEAEGEWFFTMELIEGCDFIEYVRQAGGGSIAEDETLDSASARAATLHSDRGKQPTSESLEDTLQADSADALANLPSGDAAVVQAPTQPAQFDEPKLRAALGQLAVGLSALHSAGKVHRDIKPSNVRVTPEGRVVLLDFGLIAEVAQAGSSLDAHIVGTAAYMAPEQAQGKHVGPAADWYAFGVVLYQALTGKLPFTGKTPMDLIIKKQQYTLPPPRAWAPGIPEDLDSLCVQLLQKDADRRPDGRTILELLAVQPAYEIGGASSSSYSTRSFSANVFVGREPEVAAIRDAFEEVAIGRPVTVFVEGESGLGKSTLVRHVAESLLERTDGDDESVLFTGRCYERESVPFKAFDGVIDALAHYLERLPPQRAAEILPDNAALLPRVFPVLGAVPAIANARRVHRDVRDDHELRKRVFAAIRELLGRLSDRLHPILVIDDLQWADRDSLRLLADVLRPPDAPRMLLLVTSRDAAAVSELPGDVRHMQLGSLPPASARKLASTLLELAGAAESISPDSIAEEAGGHPLYIDELVRHATAAEAPSDLRPRLDDAIWSRVSRLPDSALKVLQLASVAGAPLPQEVSRTAARLDGIEFGKVLSLLRVGNLVRTGGARGTDVLEVFHDRVRETVLSHVDEERRRRFHTELGIALEASAAAADRPELLVRHLQAAGQHDRAAKYAFQAAERARRALAFDRAAELYSLALELGNYSTDEARAIYVSLGDTLANAGRGSEAADAYLAAADGADENLRRQCNTNAAHQLLATGYIERGIETTQTVLSGVGASLPAGPIRSLLSLLWRRARVRLRGRRWAERIPSSKLADVTARVDAFQSVGNGLLMVDPVLGADFQARGMLLALKLGERSRVARALTWEAIYAASLGGKGIARGREIVDELRMLGERSDDAYCIALGVAADGIVSHLGGRFKRAARLLPEAEAKLRDLPTSTTIEVNNIRLFNLFALHALGTFGEHVRAYEEYLRDAQQRDDQYAVTSFRRHSSLLWLGLDRPDEARRALEETTWSPPGGGYHLQHWYEFQASCEIALYEGDTVDNYEALREGYLRLEKSLLMRSWLVRVVGRGLWGRVAIAAAAENPELRPRALPQATKAIRRLARERHTIPRVAAVSLEAGVRAVNNEVAKAIELLGEVISISEKNELYLLAESTRYRRGKLMGGPAGDQQVAQAEEWMDREGIANPERISDLFNPGFRNLKQLTG